MAPKSVSSGNRIFVGATLKKTVATDLQNELDKLTTLNIHVNITDFNQEIAEVKKQLSSLDEVKVVHLTVDDKQLLNTLGETSEKYAQNFANTFNTIFSEETTNKLTGVFDKWEKTVRNFNTVIHETHNTLNQINEVSSGNLTDYAQSLAKVADNFNKFNKADFEKIQNNFIKISKHAAQNPINFKVGFQIRESAQELQKQARSIQYMFNKDPGKTSGLGTAKGINVIQFGAAFRDDAAKQLTQKVAQLQQQFNETDKSEILFDITPEKLLNDLLTNINAVNAELIKPAYQLKLKLNNNELSAEVSKIEVLLKRCVTDANEAIATLKRSQQVTAGSMTDTTEVKAKSKSKAKNKAELTDLSKLQSELTRQLTALNQGLTDILVVLNNQKEQGLKLDEKALEILKQQTSEMQKQEDLAASKTSKSSNKKQSDQLKELTLEQAFRKIKSNEKLILDAERKLAATDPTNNKLIAVNKTILQSAQERYEAELKTLNLTKAQTDKLRENLELQREAIVAESEQEKAAERIQDYRNKTNAALQNAEKIAMRIETMVAQHKLDDTPETIEKIAKLESLVATIRTSANDMLNNLEIDDVSTFSDNYLTLKETVKQAKLLGDSLQNSHTYTNYIGKDLDKLNNLSADLVRYINKYGSELRKNHVLYQRFLDLQTRLELGTVSESDARIELKQLQREARAAGIEVDTLWKKLKRTFGSRVRSALSGQGVFLISTSFRQMYQNVLQLDTAMTELRKVTSATEKEYLSFLNEANVRARKLGATLVDTVSASADMARLGYNLEDASALADTALIYQNVGDGVESVDDATSSIISTMQAFNVEAKDSLTIVDKFNAIGNRFATTSGDVGEALKRSASAMESANNTLDETIALYTAAQTTVQDADVVGTALKTLSLRIRGAKSELEDAGLETEGMADSTSKLREEIQALTGVDIMLDDDTFKSTYQILKEISEVWDQITDVSQANVLELLFAKRQSNIGAAILKDFDLAEEALKVAAEATGSALKENEVYLESIQGRLDKLTATWQTLSNNILDDSVLKTAVSAADTLLGIVNTLVDKLGLIPGLLAAGATAWAKTNQVGKECALLYQAA